MSARKVFHYISSVAGAVTEQASIVGSGDIHLIQLLGDFSHWSLYIFGRTTKGGEMRLLFELTKVEMTSSEFICLKVQSSHFQLRVTQKHTLETHHNQT